MRDILEFYHSYFSQNIEFDTFNSEISKNHLAINKLLVFALHLSGRNLVRKIEYFLDIIKAHNGLYMDYATLCCKLNVVPHSVEYLYHNIYNGGQFIRSNPQISTFEYNLNVEQRVYLLFATLNIQLSEKVKDITLSYIKVSWSNWWRLKQSIFIIHGNQKDWDHQCIIYQGFIIKLVDVQTRYIHHLW